MQALKRAYDVNGTSARSSAAAAVAAAAGYERVPLSSRGGRQRNWMSGSWCYYSNHLGRIPSIALLPSGQLLRYFFTG